MLKHCESGKILLICLVDGQLDERDHLHSSVYC